MSDGLDKHLSVAPMMDWTDRHCRYLHRLITKHTFLYTEMITAAAVLHGDRDRLLGFDATEHPVALQLGGSDPDDLAEATRIAVEFGYDEVNLNVGCPSDRVQSGTFGAVLMKSPDLVARCLAAMRDAAGNSRVTVKCRIGVDDQNPAEVLPDFLTHIRNVGITHVAVHARMAWLQGLSPKKNREVPPLKYDLVYQMKREFPDLCMAINGGVGSLEEVRAHFANGMDGAMIGRQAYHDPMSVLSGADQMLAEAGSAPEVSEIIDKMLPYIDRHVVNGGRLGQITRHMMGLYAGQPGARAWRRTLSEGAHQPGAGCALIENARAAVEHAQDQAISNAMP